MVIISNYRSKKVYHFLKEKPDAICLFVFNHGMGDLVLFLSLFEELKLRFPDALMHIGVEEKKAYFQDICNDIVLLSDDKYNKKYDYIFKLRYPEPKDTDFDIQKPYLCNQLEMGIPNFEWKPFRYDWKVNKSSKIVGVHFGGVANKIYKVPEENKIQEIILDIENAGYKVVDVEFLPIDQLFETLKKCRFFVGVDSGPLYLAGSIIGYENIVGVERYMKISRILPLEIEILQASFYASKSILKSFDNLINKKKYKTHKSKPIKSPRIIEYDNNYKEILITAGIGDFITLESYFPDELKNNLETVYYATRCKDQIKLLLDSIKNVFPNLQNHLSIWDDFSKFWCFIKKEDMYKIDKEYEYLLKNVTDYSIFKIFHLIDYGVYPFIGSSLIKNNITDISNFDLPENYIVICPYSGDKRNAGRDFNDKEWFTILRLLESLNKKAVILNIGKDRIPNNKNLINLSNKTNLLEAIEIVKNAEIYIGIDSCLSVIASQNFIKKNLIIKSVNPHLYKNKHIYYSPYTNFDFIYREINIDCFGDLK